MCPAQVPVRAAVICKSLSMPCGFSYMLMTATLVQAFFHFAVMSSTTLFTNAMTSCNKKATTFLRGLGYYFKVCSLLYNTANGVAVHGLPVNTNGGYTAPVAFTAFQVAELVLAYSAHGIAPGAVLR